MSGTERSESDGGVLLQVMHLSKRYPGVLALDDVSMEVMAGSTHAVIGENGAGKSTLVDLIGGMATATSGSVRFAGEIIDALTPRVRLEHGIAVVSQGLRLVPHLDVAHNLMLTSRIGRGRGRMVARAQIYRSAQATLADFGLDGIDVRALPGDLGADQQQLLAIVRALETKPRLLLLDEPTSNLDAVQVEWLFELLREAQRSGLTTIFVSHRLPEVRALTERVTVLRDGRVTGEGAMAQVPDAELIWLMAGREVSSMFPERGSRSDGEVALKVEGLVAHHSGERLTGVDFEVRTGEVVGIAGVQGNGQECLLRTVAGLVPVEAGTIRVGGTQYAGSARAARRRGVLFVPKNRREGVFSLLSLTDNLVIGNIEALSVAGYVPRTRERRLADTIIRRFQIRSSGPNQAAGLLSGGNQQKVVIGRTLAHSSQVLLLDDPTQGVDVGTKADIYQVIARTAASGIAVLFFSTDMTELVGLCDRVLVLSRGRVIATLPRGALTEERLVAAATLADTSRREIQSPVAHTQSKREPSTNLAQGRDVSERKHPTVPRILPIVGILMALCVVTECLNGAFLGSINLYTLLQSLAPLVCVAIGETFVLLVGGMDLSVGPLMSVVTVVASYTLVGGAGKYWPAIVMILAIGVSVGLFNGLLVEVAGLPDLVATLGTYTVLEGVALILRAEPGGTIATSFSDALGARVAFVPVTFIMVLVAAAVAWWFLFRNRLGIEMRAVGSSRGAARVTGINVKRSRILAYAISAVMASIAGLFLASIIQSGDPASGNSFVLEAIAAPVVGGVSLSGGVGSPVGTVIGACVIGGLANLLTLQGVSAYWQQVLTGLLTALAVASYSFDWAVSRARVGDIVRTIREHLWSEQRPLVSKG